MSPSPSRFSAPFISIMVLESVFEETWKVRRVGKFALMIPVSTSTDGLCVASIRCIPAALAICARRVNATSTSLEATIIRSASSSIIMTMRGSFCNPSSSSGFFSFSILLLYCFMFLAFFSESSSYLLSISRTAQKSAFVAFFTFITTGVIRWGIPS